MMGRWLKLARKLSGDCDNSDKWDNSHPKGPLPSCGEPIVPFVTIVTADTQQSDLETKILVWINNNPPNLPIVQKNCVECGEFIPVYDTGWVILCDGALTHYSGKHGDKCWKAWSQKRRNEAKAQLGVPEDD
jgi:hypothetical protein